MFNYVDAWFNRIPRQVRGASYLVMLGKDPQAVAALLRQCKAEDHPEGVGV